MRLAAQEAGRWTTRDVADEIPVAFRYAGLPHAVMMATPGDLDDFARGFSLAEGIVSHAADIRSIEATPACDAIDVDVTLAPAALQAYLGRRRHRALRAYTSCGVCGTQDVAGIPLPGPPTNPLPIQPASIRHAVVALREFQPLSQATRAAHAAAWVSMQGGVRIVREDVGRHNALDKLVGACMVADVDLDDGFCLITSRCSYEMVQKATMFGFRALVAMSAPTLRAIDAARASGIALTVQAASEAMVSFPGQ